MYKVSVPVINGNVTPDNREAVLRELRRFDAERVFLALGFYELDGEKCRKALSVLKDNCRFFKEQGLEVGTWLWALTMPSETAFTHMRSLSGKDHPQRVCPADENFRRFSVEYVKKLAACGVDLIMFDDDLCYGALTGSPNCLCDKHVAKINAITGEENDRETLAARITQGGKNKYRDAWLQANGDALRCFAREIREAVDAVEPTVRVGACACMSSFDIDGTDPAELARLFAGNTKPFFRLIGAPYWAVRKNYGCDLQDVVELSRMESAWVRAADIEIMAEGDAFPRPRYNCPAAYLEGFDTAIRVAGCTDGILKYGLDYTSDLTYETDYARFHERNRDVYEGIDAMFAGKAPCGVRVWESMRKVADLKAQTALNGESDWEKQFQSKAARTLAHNSIPTVYEGEGICGIVFDENARAMPLSALQNGLILDLAAAEILTARGVDVGIRGIGAEVTGEVERILVSGNRICHYFSPVHTFDNEFAENVEVLSVLQTSAGEIPLVCRYENADGNRFLFFNINSRPEGSKLFQNTHFGRENVLRNYERGKQIAENTAWLSGKRLPAFVYGCPEMYLQCKTGEGKLAVGLWNFFADEAIDCEVVLAKRYSRLKPLNCHGTLSGERVTIDRVPPFGFAFFEVEE